MNKTTKFSAFMELAFQWIGKTLMIWRKKKKVSVAGAQQARGRVTCSITYKQRRSRLQGDLPQADRSLVRGFTFNNRKHLMSPLLGANNCLSTCHILNHLNFTPLLSEF